MKRYALLALAGSAMAQVPAPAPTLAPAPVPAPVAPVDGAKNLAPLAPIHDVLLQGNPAVDGSIALAVSTPHDFYGQRAAAFQWAGGTSDFQGNAIAVCDKVFAGFDVYKNFGNLTGGYMTRTWGAGARLTFNRYTASTSDSITNPNLLEADSSYSPTSIGAFGSMALENKQEAYARIDWFTPSSYGSRKTDTYVGANRTSSEVSSRADGFHVGGGVRTEAKGPRGYSWNVALDYANFNVRNSGQPSDSTFTVHTIHELGQLGKTVEADGNVLAMGVDQRFILANGRGGSADTSYTVVTAGRPGAVAYQSPDWRYWVTIEPNLAVIIPIFESWTLLGGAKTGLVYTRWDEEVGEKGLSEARLTTTAPTGNVGVRYAKPGARWAAEAEVSSELLSNGPYFVTGAGTTKPALMSFAVTVGIK